MRSLMVISGCLLAGLIVLLSCGMGDKEEVRTKTINDITLSVDLKEDVREEGYLYFTLKASAGGGSMPVLRHKLAGQEDYNERVYYYSYKFDEDIFLEADGTRIPCSLYHFERTYDLVGFNSFSLGFELKDEDIKEVTLVIDSPALDVGIVKFNFRR